MDSYVKIHSLSICILCFSLGILLLITNLPVLYAILASSKLRIRYGVLALLLLAAAITGFNCFLRATSIILELWSINGNDCMKSMNGSSLTRNRPWNCLGPVASYFELFSFLLLPTALLLNSTDRLLVIYNPIGYFLHPKLYLIVQFSVAGLFQLSIIFYVIIAKFNSSFPINNCTCYVMMSQETFFFLLFIRMCTSTISIFVMLVVLFKFRRRVQNVTCNDRHLTNFNSRQRGFTQAMFFCCCFTFVFFVLPNVAAYCFRLLNMKNADLYNAYLKLISYTSTLDILIIMLYRQKDITEEVLQRFPFLLRFRILLRSLLKS